MTNDTIRERFEGELRTACENFHDSWFCYSPNPSIQERQEFSRLLYNFVKPWYKAGYQAASTRNDAPVSLEKGAAANYNDYFGGNNKWPDATTNERELYLDGARATAKAWGVVYE